MSTIAYFEIQSSEPAREIAFYEAVFGWKFIRETNHSLEYYRIETPGMYGGLMKRPMAIPDPKSGTNAFTCSVQVESFDAFSDLIVQKGGKLTLPKFAVPGRCWQGYFTDPDNNSFGIFEVDENAK